MNRSIGLYVALVIAVVCNAIESNDTFAAPQEIAVGVAEAEVRPENASPEQYQITVAQYRLKEIDPSDLTTEYISAVIRNQKATPVEAVMLSATADNESRVSLGRTVSVSVGKVISGRERSARQAQRRDLGTVLSATLTPDKDNVIARLKFDSTWQTGKGTEDSPTELATTSFESSQLFELGQPTLVAASTGGETTYVLLTIARR